MTTIGPHQIGLPRTSLEIITPGAPDKVVFKVLATLEFLTTFVAISHF